MTTHEDQLVGLKHAEGDGYSCPGDSGCPVFLHPSTNKAPILLGLNTGGTDCPEDGERFSYFTPVYKHVVWLGQRRVDPTPVGATLPAQVSKVLSPSPVDEREGIPSPAQVVAKPAPKSGDPRPFLGGTSGTKGCKVRGPLFNKPKGNPQVPASRTNAL